MKPITAHAAGVMLLLQPQLLCKCPNAQIWNNLYSCFSSRLSSHSHPSRQGKVPIHSFLGSDVFDYSSASRQFWSLPKGDRQFSEPRSLICKPVQQNESGTIGGKIPKPSESPGQVSKLSNVHADWEGQNNGQQSCIMSTHLLDNINQDTTALDSKSMWKYF